MYNFLFFVVFTLVLLLLICWQTYLSLLFVAQKVAKRHSTDKIIAFSELRLRSFTICKLQACIVLTCTNFHPLLCSGILVNQNILRSAFVCRQLSLESHGSVKFGHTLCVRKFASLFRVFLQPLPVILTVLYFWKISFAMVIANLCNIFF